MNPVISCSNFNTNHSQGKWNELFRAIVHRFFYIAGLSSYIEYTHQISC